MQSSTDLCVTVLAQKWQIYGYIPVHAGYIPVLCLETKKQDNNNLAELEASLAPVEAEFGAVAKADQKILLFLFLRLKLSEMGSNCCLTASIDTQWPICTLLCNSGAS